MKNLDSQNISKLVFQTKTGDRKAFSALYDFFSPKLIHTARRMFVSKEDAEGMAQDIFIFIWEKRENLNPELSFNAYLLTILKSKLYKKGKAEARKTAYQKYAIKFQEYENSATESEVMYEELKMLSSKAIENLPKQQKQIFLWKGLENLTSDEIASKLGLSKRTVENHFYQAKKKLQTEINKEYAVPVKKLSVLFLAFILK
ncbi:putative ECF-type RNA polymerase sigma factor [Indibacter alkaliphilus LW1]|jgi:RNA polymerase sigma-70 factor (family 1)|uniref:ECF-type RNA polymerase sigma factor n=1 Tax=Indibacter alkaliphilus (strain CCUG 57479 / KCTC 22604 / LW1) TaxID=1189612 RepID=S2E1U4_INDAL|nr:sigma-70 family RNA polymerase sigma factor [Indibacter alkaliphilus]EOZ98441.1 putative ECF-type RNA polymerase sigma factor [Indibacter alkaliphilus LW1]